MVRTTPPVDTVPPAVTVTATPGSTTTSPIVVVANVTLEADVKCALAPGLHAVAKGAGPEADQLEDVHEAAGPLVFQ